MLYRAICETSLGPILTFRMWSCVSICYLNVEEMFGLGGRAALSLISPKATQSFQAQPFCVGLCRMSRDSVLCGPRFGRPLCGSCLAGHRSMTAKSSGRCKFVCINNNQPNTESNPNLFTLTRFKPRFRKPRSKFDFGSASTMLPASISGTRIFEVRGQRGGKAVGIGREGKRKLLLSDF